MATNPLKSRIAAAGSISRPDLVEARQRAVAHGNAHLAEIGRDHELHWYIHKDQLLIGAVGAPIVGKRDLMDRRGEPMSRAETDNLNSILEGLGATVRYRTDGSRYTLGGDA